MPCWPGAVASTARGHANWWIPSGRVFCSPNPGDTSVQELAYARQHFFLPHRFRDPFHTAGVSTETFLSYDYDLLLRETRDPLGNRITVGERDVNGNLTVKGNDYRVLQPRLVMDPNRNRAAVAFDALGLVVGTAVMGKAGEDLGDSLDGFVADLSPVEIGDFIAQPRAAPPGAVESEATPVVHDLLGKATTRIVYDLERFRDTRRANPDDPRKWEASFAATIARETHVSDLAANQRSRLQVSVSYSDGFGREIQKKTQAEAGPVPKRDAAGKIIVGADGQAVMTPSDVSPRWVGSGWTVFNNKGKPVRQYEPFFTDRHGFEFGVRIGVSPVVFYDPVERVVATLHPNHTWEKVVFDPWRQTTYDVNDTVLNADGSTDPKSDQDVKGFFSRLPDADYLPTWYEQRIALAANYPERVAAEKAAVHRQTPTVAHLETLGRPVLTIALNRFERNGAVREEAYSTRLDLDIEGNQRAVRDAVTQDADPLGRVVMRYDYDMLGNRIHQASMEAGERWVLNDVMGKPIRAWDSRLVVRRMTYDQLRRLTDLFVTENGAERLAERTVYGENQGDAANHRTRVRQVLDDAGIVTSEAYDFKGNLLSGKRDLRTQYKTPVNWAQQPAPATSETFASSSSFDALNRVIAGVAPDGSVTRPRYNEATLLDAVEVRLPGAAQPSPFVTDIDYDAKGQRERIAYGNGAQTAYEYDPLTFRLTKLTTTRPANPDATASQLFKSETLVQDLRYTYDPAGNITRIEDGVLKTIIHNGEQVEPVCQYTYDAVYRLIEAKGREHIGQTAHDFNPLDDNRRDYPFFGLRTHPNDAQAMRNYTERYEYDPVGNFEIMRHIANGGGWTRTYEYAEASLTEPGKQSNRLSKTTVGNGGTFAETYSYNDALGNDVHGCMTAINSMKMRWDFEDQLTEVDLQGGGMAHYVYDAAGQRVRKVIERNGATVEERIYLGGYEVFRKRLGNALRLERQTLHLMDDKQRIATVETRTQGVEPGVPARLVRYQFGNHLGSACLELDHVAQIVSYEEYTPYGSASYQAVRSQTETPKRHRFTRKERDEETGLYYYGARYYAPWLGRWLSCDPAWMVDGTNLYLAVCANPIVFADRAGFQANAAEDLFQFVRNQAAFVEGKVNPPTIDVEAAKRQASDFGMRAQRRIETVIHDARQGGVKGAEHVYSEVAVERGSGKVVKVGGNPIPEADNLDLVKMPEGSAPLTKGSTLEKGGAELVGDVKHGKGAIPREHAAYGSRGGVTVGTKVTPRKGFLPASLEAVSTAATKSKGAVSRLAQKAGAAKKVLGPVGVAVGAFFLAEKVAHAATDSTPAATDTAGKMEQALQKTETAVDIAADAAAFAPGPVGGIATAAIVNKELAIRGIQATGGDQRIIEAGKEAESAAKGAGWSDVNAETAGAVSAGTVAVVEGGNIIGMAAMGPLGWGMLAAKYALKK